MLGLAREKIPAYATARNIEPTPEDVYKEAAERKAQGYHGFKIQFWDGLDRDIPRFRAAREAVGDGYPLMQDAAGMYTYTQALAAGKVLGDLDYEWFEEPIPDRNLFQLQRLTDQLDVPILAGETSRVHELAEMIRMGACDIARGDVHMKEGITGLHKAAGMADLLGFELEVHGINQPLLDTANLHVALSMSNGRWSETFHPIYYRGLKGGPLDIDAEGYKHLPPGPGPRRRARLGLDRRQHPLDAADARRLPDRAYRRTIASSRQERRAPVAIATAARPSWPSMVGGRSSSMPRRDRRPGREPASEVRRVLVPGRVRVGEPLVTVDAPPRSSPRRTSTAAVGVDVDDRLGADGRVVRPLGGCGARDLVRHEEAREQAPGNSNVAIPVRSSMSVRRDANRATTTVGSGRRTSARCRSRGCPSRARRHPRRVERPARVRVAREQPVDVDRDEVARDAVADRGRGRPPPPRASARSWRG